MTAQAMGVRMVAIAPFEQCLPGIQGIIQPQLTELRKRPGMEMAGEPVIVQRAVH